MITKGSEGGRRGELDFDDCQKPLKHVYIKPKYSNLETKDIKKVDT